ncbi:hypothetical protein [Corallococcus sp. 4LFB]|uniref:hypothetical protein n=1 Tax=Corallococcus sp. 4LFB TaxID=3383249 RepID=UPI0039761A84
MSLNATTSTRTNSVFSNRSQAVTTSAVRNANPNAILSQYKPTGASARTAAQDGLQPGVAASTKMAQTDLARLQKFKGNIEAAAAKHGLPPRCWRPSRAASRARARRWIARATATAATALA